MRMPTPQHCYFRHCSSCPAGSQSAQLALWTLCNVCRDPVTKSTPTWEYDQAELKKLLSKMGLVSLPHACLK